MKYLIVGLGNVGPEYADTRHNIGFMVLDTFAKVSGTSFITQRLAWYAETSYKGRSLFLIKPTTFMNLSGKAVHYWMQQLRIPESNTLIVLDDLALPFGTIRLRAKGSDAGHNGLKSINQALGTSDYPRLRFGIGNNYPKGHQVDYVLSSFDPEEEKELPLLLEKSVNAIQTVVHAGLNYAMTVCNR